MPYREMTASLLIHPEELDPVWIDRCAELGIPTLALHPVGGYRAPRTMEEMLDRLQTAEMRALIDLAAERGLRIEYEMHAMRYFLPASEFAAHPDWFRMNEQGERTPDRNCCCSNADALDYIARRAAETASRLYRSTHRYFFWLDDAEDAFCHCSACAAYSSSEQQLIIMNRMLAELRTVDPEATLAYLAYFGTLTPPRKVKPDEGIFLEYAPIARDHHKPIADLSDARNKTQSGQLSSLLDVFGRRGAKVLDYWLDNSLFSGWKKPPKAFSPDRAVIDADFAYYTSLGFSDISCFACYLGADYRALYGEPDIAPFAAAYAEALRQAK
ncbi:MAG: DUF4838 domain-containing protein [Clostridia bacterium]|nr:DUF4838 domain-containing protein [Clostridia bacterium]